MTPAEAPEVRALLHCVVVNVNHHKAIKRPAAAIGPMTTPLFSTCPAAPVEVAPDEVGPD
jgi:hypothetical protein